MDIVIVIALISASGMFSGLTIGLMGLSVEEVKRSADLGDTKAIRVLPIVKRANLLLVTLLLGNTAVNASLAVFLGGIVGEGIIAGVISTALILIFGEILPAAILTRHALYIGAQVAGFVKLLMILFYPVAGPIAIVLDRLLGEEIPAMLSRHELRHVIESHHRSADSDIDALDRDMLVGALSLQEKQAQELMTPREKVFMLDSQARLSEDLIGALKRSGYTRFPIVEDDRVIRILNIKRLVGVTPDGEFVRDFAAPDKVIHVPAHKKADDMLNMMIKSRVHIAAVIDSDGWAGIVTMEDVLEALVGHEITDEYGH